MVCTHCGKVIENVMRDEVPKNEWDTWICSECDGSSYGQQFINWIEDRISASTNDDTTGKFVLRELVQNADDVESDIIVLKFCEDALYVYNNGFGFRSRKGEILGDFDRISRVLAKPKEKEYFTSGNFGSGFQTVYLFTNYPEVHSHGNSFRFDPTVPRKDSLSGQEKLESPYVHSDSKKGVVFRFPWRTKDNAIVIDDNGNRSFENEHVWKRWDQSAREELYEQLQAYLHDSLICCQHLKKIRLLWESNDRKIAYQAERDFTLEYIHNDGKVRSVKEGKGKGDLLLNDWEYYAIKEFKYLIGSSFVHDIDNREPNIYLIVSDISGKQGLEIKSFVGHKYGPELPYHEYRNFLDEKKAVKKSEVHILLPIFPWEERAPNYERKAWSYSVIPLPKESGNNFTMTAHLFPKQTREAFEGHLDKAKKEWLEKVLLSAAKLYLRTYAQFINAVRRSAFDMSTKQRIMLDYLPEMKLGKWVNVSLENTDVEEKIEDDFIIQVFSKDILLYRDKWFSPFRYDPSKNGLDALTEQVAHPRDDIERSLLQEMGKVTFTKEFVDHHRFKELDELKTTLDKKMKVDDSKFAGAFNQYSQKLKNKGLFVYGKGPLNQLFVQNLINHCLGPDKTATLKSLPIVPNKNGMMLTINKLKKEPDGEFSVLSNILRSDIYPHPHFALTVKDHLDEFTDPRDLLEGMKENKEFLEKNIETLRECYKWLANSNMKIPENVKDYPIIISDPGTLLKIEEVCWIPTEHHETICELIGSVKYDVNIVSKQIFSEFGDFISKTLQVKMLDYRVFVEKYLSSLEGNDDPSRKIQSMIVEGILLNIESKQYLSDNDKNIYSKLRFLPVKGKLNPPSNVCLGESEDEKIDLFLGTIDEHVQKLILTNVAFVKRLKELGMGDLGDNPVDWIVEQIDRFANGSQDNAGICYLDEEKHKIISRCLEILSEEKNLSQNTSIMSKRVLPVTYHGRVILSTLPRWDTKDADRRTENYERDWPWVSPKSEHLEAEAKVLWDEIKFIKLSDGFEKAQDKIIKEFNIERLIAITGVPRNLILYFLAPRDNDKSLFFEENIREFFRCAVLEVEIDRLKRIFLRYIQSYYKTSDHSTENKMEIKNKPCLYGPEGVWTFPKDFAFNVDEDMTNIGYHQLSSDFSDLNGWDRQTLKNIGVVDNIEFSKLEQLFKKVHNEPVGPENAKQVLKALILAMEENIGSPEDWKRISEVKWVPKLDSTWAKPKDTMPPLDDIVQLIGSNHGSLIDTSVLNIKDRNRLLGSDIAFKHIGFRTEPTYDEMMSVWTSCQEEGVAPPPKLFDRLENDFHNWSSKYESFRKDLKYFYEGKWTDPHIVFVGETESIPGPLAERFVFSDEHEKIINWLKYGSTSKERPRIKAQDALSIMDQLSIEEKRLVWKFIVDNRSGLVDYHSTDHAKKAIVPISDKVFSPEMVIIPDDDDMGISLRGTIGNLYVINDFSPDEKDVLLKLGAKQFGAIRKESKVICSILDFIVKKGPIKGTEQWSDFIKLLNVSMKFITSSSFDIPLVPIKKEEGTFFKEPKDVLIVDEFNIWEYFKDDARLNFFDANVFVDDDIDVTEFLIWIKDCGATGLDSVLIKNEPAGHKAMKDLSMTGRVADSFARLKKISSEQFEQNDYNKILSKIADLSNSSIYICEDITRSYIINMDTIGGPIERIRKDDKFYYDRSQKVFFIHKSNAKNIDVIKEFILDELDPGFNDRYRKGYWKKAVDMAFQEDCDLELDYPFYPIYEPVRRSLPDLQENLRKMEDWWKEHSNNEDISSSFPTLDGDFWWPALGFDDMSGSGREELIKQGLLTDKKLMFNIFSMATFLSSNVDRTQIRNYLKLLSLKGLSFSQIYDMGEEEVIKGLIDDALESSDLSSLQEKHYPEMRRRILDILIIRRALKDDHIGDNLLEMLKAHMEDGISPEDFLTTGHGYDNRPFMKGFKGMFTGQIYFIVRETVRLGLADKWSEIAFHAPTQVRTLIDNIGGEVTLPSSPSGREKMAKYMIEKISSHETLRNWYDIPFFIYYDEYCRNCINGRVQGKECPLICYRKR